jgi:caffeoyl-CoA O-methyltransferase
MKSIILALGLSALVSFALTPAAAAEPKSKPKGATDRYGFNYGGAPEWDKPPVPRDDKEKEAQAALEAMTKGKWHLNITTREGRVLRQLVETTGAKRIVEIGTSSGYSAIWLAMGARATGGEVFTHEIDPKMVKLARENFKNAGVEDVITVIEGDAHKTIKQHKDPKEPIDILFLDAEKKGYLDYMNQLLPFVRPGGLILGHDMHRRPMPDPRFIEAITTSPDLDTSFIMMESFGISMTVKKR